VDAGSREENASKSRFKARSVLIRSASTGLAPELIIRRKEIPMKLYYSPGACSLSPHIALLEAGLPHDLVKVDLRAKKLENGDDYLKINPKGQVPALALDNGDLVTEGPVIVQMIADKVAAKNLAPARDSAERYKLLEWLNFITAELHKNFGPMFSPVLADEAKAFFKDRVMGKFKYVDSALAGRDYLMGKQFTVADAYLFTMLSWADRMKFDLSAMPNLLAYKARVAARPKVQEAMSREGLLKAA
jgi:glutathione S-transferase